MQMVDEKICNINADIFDVLQQIYYICSLERLRAKA